jgi:2-alkyl-3-oxoalkanoate reductase
MPLRESPSTDVADDDALSEGSGDYPDTGNATDAVPAQVGGLTTVWSARVPGAMKSRPVRLLRLQRAAPGRARGVAHPDQAWDEDDTPFLER